jgi:hypothetical protein
LQKAVPSPARTTVTSMAGFGEKISASAGFMAFGTVAQIQGMDGDTLAAGIARKVRALAFV